MLDYWRPFNVPLMFDMLEKHLFLCENPQRMLDYWRASHDYIVIFALEKHHFLCESAHRMLDYWPLFFGPIPLVFPIFV
jgi:hypothetical protein